MCYTEYITFYEDMGTLIFNLQSKENFNGKIEQERIDETL